MKLVKKDRLAIITANAEAFEAIRNTLMESNEGANPEEITAQTIIEAMEHPVLQAALTETETQLTETQALLAAETEALETANARIAELEAEMEELDATPAKEPATITPKGDASGEVETIAEFANKNIGNTQDILAMAQKDGLI